MQSCDDVLSLYTHPYTEKISQDWVHTHTHIRQKFPIVYTFSGCYNIDQTTEGPYLSYDYIILTPSPGVRDKYSDESDPYFLIVF